MMTSLIRLTVRGARKRTASTWGPGSDAFHSESVPVAKAEATGWYAASDDAEMSATSAMCSQLGSFISPLYPPEGFAGAGAAWQSLGYGSRGGLNLCSAS